MLTEFRRNTAWQAPEIRHIVTKSMPDLVSGLSAAGSASRAGPQRPASKTAAAHDAFMPFLSLPA